MELKAKILCLETGGKPIVILNKEDAEDLDIRSSDRVRLKFDKKEITAIVDVTTKIVSRGSIGVCEELENYLKVKENDRIKVTAAKFPVSLDFIKSKINGRNLGYEEMLAIVKDVVEGNLEQIEIASFVTALATQGLSLDEAAYLSAALVETGKNIKFNKGPVVDKHSIGGVPGDKSTMLVVPIVAAAGLTIPKTSSRAITSAAGTADKAEVLMPVNLEIEDMVRVVESTGGCMVWGGNLNLAPADDLFIKVEYPLSIDPLMLPSIMSKKKAVNSEYLVVDIPTGRGTKIKTIGDADLLARNFIELGNKLGIKTQCVVSYGEEPIGLSIGPALEAKEALEILMRHKNVPDATDKATNIAGILFEMVGKAKPGEGQSLAMEMLKSGKAEKKLREIIMHQGGDSEIKPADIPIGSYGFDVCAEKSGIVMWINNNKLVRLVRAAGSPKDKGAGVELYKKIGDKVEKGGKLFTVYAEKTSKLNRAREVLEEEEIENVMGAGERREMIIHIVKEIPAYKKSFILER
jgi:AMP phosphorylase